jgi:predicted NBD/HSP70 family sugar kinase
MKGVNHRAMNENNKYQILRALVILGPCSRSQLCEYTGLSKMTISNLVGEYIRQGVVEESVKLETSKGRKAVLIRLVLDSLLTLGILVMRDNTEIGIINLNGEVIRSEHFEIRPGDTVEDFLETLIYLCSKFVNSEWHDRIWGIGVSAMGPLDSQRGIILEPPDFHNLKNIPIVESLYKAFKIPTYLELEIQVAAMSEIYYGNKKGFVNFLYVSMDNWIGGCAVINRMVYRGSSGLAGHMGGVIVDREAMKEGQSLSGCLQGYASILALTTWARENGVDPNITWNHITTAARHGEAFARSVIDRLVRYLEMAIINAIALLDIQCVYLTGPMLHGEDLFIKRLEESVNRHIFAPDSRYVEILAARYSNRNAQLVGVAPLIMERNFGLEQIVVQIPQDHGRNSNTSQFQNPVSFATASCYKSFLYRV